MVKKKTAISLFAGCGGDTLGLEQAGFKVVGFVEFVKDAIKSHHLNFPNSKLIGEEFNGDITKIPDKVFLKYKGKIDLIFAGFPCQGFSHAGKKDPNDERNKLFWEFVRVTKLINPKWIIGENVAGLLRRKTDDGKTFVKDLINDAFKSIGYNMAEPQILKSEDYGVSQKRRRVFFVGSKDKKLKFKFPKPSHDKSNFEGLKKIVDFSMEDTILIDETKFPDLKILTYINNLKNDHLPSGKPHAFLLKKVKDTQFSFSRRVSPTHVEIVDLNAPSKTIHCGYSFMPRLYVAQKNKHGTSFRPLNVQELGQIQGFPKNFIFYGNRDSQVTQIGNAVPPKLAKVIAEKILEIDKSL